MAIGVTAGILTHILDLDGEAVRSFASYVRPIGDIFLRLIFMMVIPLIVSALALGVADLGDLRKIGRVGLRTLAFAVLVSGLSVFIGVTAVELARPGDNLSPEDQANLITQYGGVSASIEESVRGDRTFGDFLSNLVPRNPLDEMVNAFNPSHTGGGLLSIMVFALLLGFALIIADGEKVVTLRSLLEGIYEVSLRIISLGMKLAPFGVAALLFTTIATLGISVFTVVLQFVLLVLAALAFHQFVTYSILIKVLGRMNPFIFFRNIAEVMATAFSTSSSNATLPVAIRVAIEKLRLPRDITHFVLTIGSTANQNGTALYEGIAVLFIAQCFGVELDLASKFLVVLLAVLGGVGTAGVPGGSLPVIMLILVTLGIPAEGIGIIYGIDRILDMSRTVLNVTGDIAAAVYVSRTEGERAMGP
jgi:DAACS family dicarboxylate/amino acid:cation (Na+ or H+) symporter